MLYSDGDDIKSQGNNLKLLLLSKDLALGDNLKNRLIQAGYGVEWISEEQIEPHHFVTQPHHAVILDVELSDSHAALQKINQYPSTKPTLLFTSQEGLKDSSIYFDKNHIFDFAVKPLNLNEIDIRLQNLVGKSSQTESSSIKHNELSLDPSSHTVIFQKRPINLSKREFTLLHFLLENRGNVVNREKIEQALYSLDIELESNAIEVHIHHLRKKLYPKLIRTVHGLGYIIDHID